MAAAYAQCACAVHRPRWRAANNVHRHTCTRARIYICDVYVAARSLTRSVHLSFRTVVSPSLFAAARDVDDDDDDCMWKRACNISRLVNIV